MGVFSKAIKGHNHNDASNTRELGHSMSYDLIQGVFYRGAGLGDDYENVYEFVRPLAERFSRIQPYAIDSNGKPVQDVPAVNALYRPNKNMSYTQFFDALMTGIKTQPEIYILVWHRKGRQLFKGGKITRDNIAGYTFLQGVSKINTNGVITYQITNGQGELENYTTDEVIVLSDSRNPANISVGYSPMKAVQKWITVDDYIVAYQQGFFANGAVPTGVFDITANTPQDFKDIKARMQEAHRGASQNNNVTYSYNPVDANGKVLNSQIKWTPYSVQNKDMELGVLTENIQKRKESVYGVPGVIRGVDDSANYATAQVMERSFVVNKLDPSTHNIWSTWTHELNRITGGLGVAITYDLEIPAVADEEKVQAETKTLEFKLITDALTAGWSLDSAIDALELSNRYKLLKTGSGAPKITNDQPLVDDGTSDDDSPDENGGSKSTNPKATKVLSVQEAEEVFEGVDDVARKHMLLQIDRAISFTKEFGDATQEMIDSFADDLLTVLIASMVASGEIEYAAGVSLLRNAGINPDLSGYSTRPEAVNSYRIYLRDVAESYSHDTALSIRRVLEQGNEDAITAQELRTNLRRIMDTDEYRVVRLARTETNYSQQMGSLEGMRQIEDEAGVTLRKVWNTSSSDPCQFCAAMAGTSIGLDEPFVKLDETVVGVDGGTFLNDWRIREETTLHSNCNCFITYTVVR